MSGADFWACAVDSFGWVTTSAAASESCDPGADDARANTAFRIAVVIFPASSRRPVTDAVTPTIRPPLLSRKFASRTSRLRSFAIGLSAALMSFESIDGP